MTVLQLIKKFKPCCAGALSLFCSLPLYCDELKLVGAELTEEQTQLLNGYQPTIASDINFNAINHDAFSNKLSTIPLLSLSVSATTNSMKGNALEFDAMYKSWAINNNFDGLHYRTLEASLTVESPLRKALDFSQSIRDKVDAACPEKLLDKMLVDGALGFNINW